MTEDQLESEALAWLAEVGYTHRHGTSIAPDSSAPQRSDYRQVLLRERLAAAINKLNPGIPAAAREDALQQVLNLGIPSLLSANRAFHKLLVAGVPVQHQQDGPGGEIRGDLVRLLDWAEPANNEWWAVNQFTVKGNHHTRRPDIILFVNGLPLVLIELKNPADTQADIGRAYDQIQTYKTQIPDLFQYNEVLVISDGSEARMGSLSANGERFQQWRTINGVDLDPLGHSTRSVIVQRHRQEDRKGGQGGIRCNAAGKRTAGLVAELGRCRRGSDQLAGLWPGNAEDWLGVG